MNINLSQRYSCHYKDFDYHTLIEYIAPENPIIMATVKEECDYFLEYFLKELLVIPMLIVDKFSPSITINLFLCFNRVVVKGSRYEFSFFKILSLEFVTHYFTS